MPTDCMWKKPSLAFFHTAGRWKSQGFPRPAAAASCGGADQPTPTHIARKKPSLAFFHLAWAVLAAAGCGRPSYTMIPVTGSVAFEGRPLPGALVIFDGRAGPRGFATTDSEGRFTLATRRYGAGLPAGDYAVFVSAAAGTEAARIMGQGTAGAATGRLRNISLGQVTVVAGQSPIPLAITRPAARAAEAEDGDSGEK